jgi:hypothetical protein
MPEPKRCTFSAAVRQDHEKHLWREVSGGWLPVPEQDADGPGVYACDGQSTRTADDKAAADV